MDLHVRANRIWIRKILNFLAIDVGWTACALGAGRGYPWIGPGVVALLLAAHFYAADSRGREALLIGAVGLLGIIADGVLTAAGAFAFHDNPMAPLIPPFMIALWLNFATGVNYSLSFLKGAPWTAAVFGLIGGPAAYYGGHRLGAIHLHGNLWFSLGAVALEWALVTPLMFGIARVIMERSVSSGHLGGPQRFDSA